MIDVIVLIIAVAIELISATSAGKRDMRNVTTTDIRLTGTPLEALLLGILLPLILSNALRLLVRPPPFPGSSIQVPRDI